MHKTHLKAGINIFKACAIKKTLTPILNILRLRRGPVIIGGCGRSGTTLLLSILSSHPHIFGIDDETYALCFLAYLYDTDSARPKSNIGPEFFPVKPGLDSPIRLDILYEYLARHQVPDSCTRWCEKTPKNILFCKQILECFGKNSRFIHVVRDGRDVVTSRHPTDPSTFWVKPTRWIQDVEAGLDYEKHPQVLTLRYEDLVTDPEDTLKKYALLLEKIFGRIFYPFRIEQVLTA